MSDAHRDRDGRGGATPPAPAIVAETLDMSPSARPRATPLPGTASPPTPPPNTAPMPQNMRMATQVSPSAVPSTLESPTNDASATAGGVDASTKGTGRPIVVDEIVGAAVVAEKTVRDDQLRGDVLREVARREAAVDTGRQAPMTLMSPLVTEAAAVDPSVPALPTAPAVTFAQPPPHAYFPQAPAASYPAHPSSPHMHAGGRHGMPQARVPPRSSNTILIVGAAVGALLLFLSLAVGISAVVIRSRQRAQQEASPAAPRTTPGAPKAPRRSAPLSR